MKDTFYTVAIFILTIAVCYGIKYIILYQKESETKKFVKWLTSDDTSAISNPRYYSLHIYLHNARIENNLSDKYAIISDVDKQYEALILDEFKKFITKKYLDNNLSLIKSKYSVSEEVQFFYFFANYLYAHETDYCFSSYKIYDKKISEKNYDTGGRDVIFALSDFGIVLYKLQYIATIGYLKSDIAQPTDLLIKNHKKHLEEVLSTGTIELLYS